MKKILVGWEAGQGLGHLSIVAPITKRLAWLQEPAEDIAVRACLRLQGESSLGTSTVSQPTGDACYHASRIAT